MIKKIFVLMLLSGLMFAKSFDADTTKPLSSVTTVTSTAATDMYYFFTGAANKKIALSNLKTGLRSLYFDTAYVRIATKQYITGKKVFSDSITFNKNVIINGTVISPVVYAETNTFLKNIEVGESLVADGQIVLRNVLHNGAMTLQALDIAGTRTISFPDTNGTVGLLGRSQTWTGLNRFSRDSLKINGLWYDYPATRIANSVLYDSLGNGILKWKSYSAMLSFKYPLMKNVDTVSLRYSLLNMKKTNDSLNTVQNIATTSSPAFAGQTINGISNTQNIYPLLTDTYDLGSWTKYWSNAYISQLQATIFAENTISAVGGYMFITKGQGLLPAVGSGTNQIDFGQTMTPGDFVLVKAKDTAGNYKTEYMTIVSFVGGTTYNVTRDVAGANTPDPAWADGTVYVVLGQNGNGRIELNAYDTPRLSIIKQGATYNSQTELIRLGDLNGFLGYSAETYGIAIGEATKYLKYDPTNGLRIAGTVNISDGTAGGWTLDATKIYNSNSYLSSTGYISFGATPPTSYGNNVGAWLGYSSGAKLSLYSDANNYMQWNGSALSVGGATITGGTIQTTDGSIKIESNAINIIGSGVTNRIYSSGAATITIDYGVKIGSTLQVNHIGETTTGHGIYVRNELSMTDVNDNKLFILNSSGQLTKVNNISPTSGYALIGDDTSYTPTDLFGTAHTWTGVNTYSSSIIFNSEATLPASDASVSVSGKNALYGSQGDAVNYTITLTSPTDGQVLFVTNGSTLAGSTYTVGGVLIGVGKSVMMRYRSATTTWYATGQ